MNVGKVARLTLGLLFVLFGLQGLTGFMGERMLPEIANNAIEMIDGLLFVRPFLALLTILTGILLLADRLVPVAAGVGFVIILAAIIYHVVFHPKGIMFALLGLIAWGVLIYDYRREFRMIFMREKRVAREQ